jgi:CubicO group peptidase (beta-lactamase class C family)
MRSIHLVLAALLAVLALTPARAQPAPPPFTDSPDDPKTPAAQRARELLDLINTGDDATARAFYEGRGAPTLKARVPLDEFLAHLTRTRRSARGLTFHSFRAYTPPRPPTQAVMIVRNTLTEGWNGLIVEVEPDAPHRLTSIDFTPARAPAGQEPPPPKTDAEAAEALRAFVDRLAKADAFSGTVLLAKDGKPFLELARGEADRGLRVPVNIDTKFNLGSMNKMFTGVACAQLVEAGKLSFDDPISKHLDESWLPKDVADTITVHHLLTHTSGLGSYFNNEFDKSSRLLFRNLDDWKPLVRAEKPAFPPGTAQQYSNTGMLLAGVIVEKVSGESYYDYIRRHVYAPAGMTGTDCYDVDEPVENLARGYFQDETPGGPRWKDNIFMHVVRGGPAGGGFSTVRDLLRLDRALRSSTLLSAASTELVWTPKPGTDRMPYGYGFGVRQGPRGRVVGHSGGFPGINGCLDMYLDTGYTVAVLSNMSDAAQLVAERAGALLPRK